MGPAPPDDQALHSARVRKTEGNLLLELARCLLPPVEQPAFGVRGGLSQGPGSSSRALCDLTEGVTADLIFREQTETEWFHWEEELRFAGSYWKQPRVLGKRSPLGRPQSHWWLKLFLTLPAGGAQWWRRLPDPQFLPPSEQLEALCENTNKQEMCGWVWPRRDRLLGCKASQSLTETPTPTTPRSLLLREGEPQKCLLHPGPSRPQTHGLLCAGALIDRWALCGRSYQLPTSQPCVKRVGGCAQPLGGHSEQ